MELIEVKITGQISTSRYGTLSTGDILRTDAAFAKHLVTECNAAEYVQSAKQRQESAPVPVDMIISKKPAK